MYPPDLMSLPIALKLMIIITISVYFLSISHLISSSFLFLTLVFSFYSFFIYLS